MNTNPGGGGIPPQHPQNPQFPQGVHQMQAQPSQQQQPQQQFFQQHMFNQMGMPQQHGYPSSRGFPGMYPGPSGAPDAGGSFAPGPRPNQFNPAMGKQDGYWVDQQQQQQQAPTQLQGQPSSGFSGQSQFSGVMAPQHGNAMNMGSVMSSAPQEQTAAPSASSNTNVSAQQEQQQTQQTTSAGGKNMAAQPPAQQKQYASDMMDEIDDMTIGELCILGKELVHDIVYKTNNLTQMLKRVMERKSSHDDDPKALSAQCSELFDNVAEVRIMIEKKKDANWKRMTTDEYLSMVCEPIDDEIDEKDEVALCADQLQKLKVVTSKEPPREGYVMYNGKWMNESLAQKYEKFEENRKKIQKLVGGLKYIEWMLAVSNPSTLKSVDKTALSRKDQNY